MTATKQNLYIEQGTDWTQRFQATGASGVPTDLTGASGRGQIRDTYAGNPPLATFDFAVVAPAVSGYYDLSLSAAASSAIPVPTPEPGDETRPIVLYIYDVELVDALGKVSRLLEGQIQLSPEVTK